MQLFQFLEKSVMDRLEKSSIKIRVIILIIGLILLLPMTQVIKVYHHNEMYMSFVGIVSAIIGVIFLSTVISFFPKENPVALIKSNKLGGNTFWTQSSDYRVKWMLSVWIIGTVVLISSIIRLLSMSFAG